MVVFFAVSAFCLCFVFAVLAQLHSARKEREFIRSMQESASRLRQVLSELMSRADEADLEGKFLSGGLNPELSKRLSRACSDLVVLTDGVELIEDRLVKRDIKSAEKKLLLSLEAVDKIKQDLQEIRSEIGRKKFPGE